jgi:hypothetical protein
MSYIQSKRALDKSTSRDADSEDAEPQHSGKLRNHGDSARSRNTEKSSKSQVNSAPLAAVPHKFWDGLAGP